MKKIALLSVSNKQGIIEFASELEKIGWNLLATGGTCKTLNNAGMQVQEVSDYTGSPEILNGRVKTLHPVIFGGILAQTSPKDDQDLDRIVADRIDMVVVNLYPFQETVSKPDVTLEQAIENIDIGGVALIRAAAKNYERVTVVTDPADYADILQEISHQEKTSISTRKKLALKAFHHTATYDQAISNYLAKVIAPTENSNSDSQWLDSFSCSELRYGENPHQQARLYHLSSGEGPLGGTLLQGKELSYNNLLDLDAAWRAVISFEEPACVIVKHLSPCGMASTANLTEAFTQALASDPVSAYGGIIATNREFEQETAEALGKLFVECIIAPSFSSRALKKLSSRKNCRLIQMPDMNIYPPFEVRSVNHGLLWQTRDQGDPSQEAEWKSVTQRAPSEEELKSLSFAWKACQHVKSNAIVLAKGQATVGIGGGQPNRVDCVQMAIKRAGENAHGAVMASDAFFPFEDSILMASEAGITAIIQPGGSIRDEDSIQAANKAGMAMVFTGVRHFRH